MARNDVEIKVIERQTPIDGNSVDYQPFGVKILKLRIQRNQDSKPDLGPIWIHPQGYTRPDAKSDDPALWRVYGTAEGDPDLWAAWGAGDERGFCVKTKDRFKIDKVPLPLDDDKFYYIYLHLIHRPQDPLAHKPQEKSITVQASGEDGQVYGETSVRLTVPEQARNPLRACWEWNPDTGSSAITLRGAGDAPAQLPLYVSRWWPVRRVEYAPVDERTAQFLHDLKITFHRQDEGGNRGRIEVELGSTPLAEFSGDIALPLHDYRLFTAEVFRFLDDHHLVVRLWFYWVHLGFSPEQLTCLMPAEHRAEAERVSADLRKGLLAWHRREEVPDVERFDLLLDLNDLNTKYVGTDTHWQEFWAIVDDGEPLQARIATLLDSAKVAALAKSVPRDNQPIFDPLPNGLCDIVNEWSGHNCPHRPQGQLVTSDKIQEGREYESCPRCGARFIGQGARALGVAKHAPLLGNVSVIENAVSSSVLEG
ncbi:MAG: hypothetical protein B6I35_09245 [Anaerolineaceae bacterium 4572_32.2]|nr:MAG: hypothetical protein B6I35_09245 [Anaerolineaceae bacterium 4572_32.2]